VGTRLALEDFTGEQVADLNRRYGLPLRSRDELAHFYRLVGGHPYLVRRGLHELASRGTSLPALEEQAGHDGIFADPLRRMLLLLARDAELKEALCRILNGQPGADPGPFYRLRSAGIVTGVSNAEARLRCQLYERYFRRYLGTG